MTPSPQETISGVGAGPPRARVLALYLPQYHPIPENDRFWGPGFTEWTNVVRGRPLFLGHRQPILPGELGLYDLRLPEVWELQAELARQHGIEGFVHWHYWFAGRRVLERPTEGWLATGRPRLPFALGWANHSWSGRWAGRPGQILIEQTFPGRDDHVAHFFYLRPFFEDPRYIRVQGKPLFLVFDPFAFPDLPLFINTLREEAARAGLPGLHLV
ncbi:MAG: lipopolysaccharide biosynthesis protein, partial [Alphaproteobacteria bacterium]|nr:lipopolysaccharide biosynthesis protein [Alphaproteobacteria bacterium]